MRIIQIRAKVKTVCVASEIYFAEITLFLPNGKYLYVTALEDDMIHQSVSKDSVYDYMDDISTKEAKLLEEYYTWSKAKTSKYAEYFKILKKVLKDLDK